MSDVNLQTIWTGRILNFKKVNDIIHKELKSIKYQSKDIQERLQQYNLQSTRDWYSTAADKKLYTMVFIAGDKTLINIFENLLNYLKTRLPSQISGLKSFFERFERLKKYFTEELYGHNTIAFLLKECIEYFVMLPEQDPKRLKIQLAAFPPEPGSNDWNCLGGMQSRLYQAQTIGSGHYFSELLNNFISMAVTSGVCDKKPIRIFPGNEIHAVPFMQFCLGIDSPLLEKDLTWKTPDTDLTPEQIDMLMRNWEIFLKDSIREEIELLFIAIDREIQLKQEKNEILTIGIIRPIEQESRICKAIGIEANPQYQLKFKDNVEIIGVNYAYIANEIMNQISTADPKTRYKTCTQQQLFSKLIARRGVCLEEIYNLIKPLQLSLFNNSENSIIHVFEKAHPEDPTLPPLSNIQKLHMIPRMEEIIQEGRIAHYDLFNNENYPPATSELPAIFNRWLQSGVSLKNLEKLNTQYKKYMPQLQIAADGILPYHGEGLQIVKKFEKNFLLGYFYYYPTTHWFDSRKIKSHNIIAELILGYYMGGISLDVCKQWFSYFNEKYPILLFSYAELQGSYPVHLMAKFGTVDLLKLFFNFRNKNQTNAWINQPKLTTQLTPVAQATISGYKEIVELLLEKEADILLKDIEQHDAVYFAAAYDRADILKLYLNDKRMKSVFNHNYGMTLLNTAIINGSLGTLRVLLDTYYSKNKNYNNQNLFPAPSDILIDAIIHEQVSIVKFLINNNWVDVNEPHSKTNKLPLFAAVEKIPKKMEIIEFLIDSGADLNAVDASGMTPLVTASFSCNQNQLFFDILKLLQRKYDEKQEKDEKDEKQEKDEKDGSPNWLSVDTIHKKIDLLEQCNRAVFENISNCAIDNVSILVQNKEIPLNVDYITQGESYFTMACQTAINETTLLTFLDLFSNRGILKPSTVNHFGRSGSLLTIAVKNNLKSALEYLPTLNGFDVNSFNEDGDTGLSVACANGNLDLVKYLVETLQANVHDGKALYYAAKSQDTKILTYLFAKGANINSRKIGFSALRGAIESNFQKNEKINDLLNKGADINHCGVLIYAVEMGDINLVTSLCNINGVNVNIIDEMGVTPLLALMRSINLYDQNNVLNSSYFDAVKKETQILQRLLAKGANIYQRGEYQQTALLAAVKNRREPQTLDLLLKQHNNIKDFISSKNGTGHKFSTEETEGYLPDYVNAVDENGNNSYILAILEEAVGSEETLTLLINNGANINAINLAGNNALMEFIETIDIYSNIFVKTLQYLCEKNINLHQANTEQQNALQLLLSKVSSMELDNDNLDALNPGLYCLLYYGAKPQGSIELAFALKNDLIDVAEILIGAGCEVNETLLKKISQQDTTLYINLVSTQKFLLSLITQVAIHNDINLVGAVYKSQFEANISITWLVPGVLKGIMSDMKSKEMKQDFQSFGKRPLSKLDDDDSNIMEPPKKKHLLNDNTITSAITRNSDSIESRILLFCKTCMNNFLSTQAGIELSLGSTKNFSSINTQLETNGDSYFLPVWNILNNNNQE